MTTTQTTEPTVGAVGREDGSIASMPLNDTALPGKSQPLAVNSTDSSPPEDGSDPFGDSALLLAALALAKQGLHVFPCGHDKKPLLKKWPEVATTDADQVRRWWAKWPDAAIGVACGPSGLAVIDLDCKADADGLSSWEALLQDLQLDEPKTVSAKTPSGGRHLWFKVPANVELRNTASRLGPGIDTRAAGGYVIAPPSQITAGSYSWLAGRSLGDVEIADLPEALVELLRKPDPEPRPVVTPKTLPPGGSTAYGLKALADECAIVRATTEGRRDTQLNDSCLKMGGLVAGGELDRATAEDALREAGLATDLSVQVVEEKIARVIAEGMATPRTAPEPTKKTAPGAPPEPSKEMPPAPDEQWGPADEPDEEAEEAEPRPPTCKAVGIGGMRAMTRDTHYLWPNVMVRGQCTALGGDWYEGKSWVGLSIAETVVSAGNWPDGTPWDGPPGRVLWYEAEGRHGIQLARLGDMGIPDEANFFFVAPAERTYYLDVSKDLAEIIAQARDIGPDLFVVDSWARAIRGRENEAEVRHIFGALQAMATELDCAMLTMHNLRKRSVTDLRGKFDFDRLRGSSAVAAGAVSLLGIDRPDPQNREARRLTVGKCTPASELPEPLGFSITDGKVVWGDAPDVKPRLSAFDEAVLFLQDVLGKGPMLGTALVELAKERGIAEKTLETARTAIGAKSRPDPTAGGKWVVSLGGDES